MFCFMPNCRHNSQVYNCRYYKFPTDQHLYNTWIRLIGSDKTPSPDTHVCSCHFKDGLSENFPTLRHMPYSPKSQFASFQYCIVKNCDNTTILCPDKTFFPVPREFTTRKIWFDAIGRSDLGFSSSIQCCEDHFDEEDTFFTVKKVGLGSKRIRELKPNAVPHIFPNKEKADESQTSDVKNKNTLDKNCHSSTKVQSVVESSDIKRVKAEPNNPEDDVTVNKVSPLEQMKSSSTSQSSGSSKVEKQDLNERIVSPKVEDISTENMSEGSDIEMAFGPINISTKVLNCSTLQFEETPEEPSVDKYGTNESEKTQIENSESSESSVPLAKEPIANNDTNSQKEKIEESPQLNVKNECNNSSITNPIASSSESKKDTHSRTEIMKDPENTNMSFDSELKSHEGDFTSDISFSSEDVTLRTTASGGRRVTRNKKYDETKRAVRTITRKRTKVIDEPVPFILSSDSEEEIPVKPKYQGKKRSKKRRGFVESQSLALAASSPAVVTPALTGYDRELELQRKVESRVDRRLTYYMKRSMWLHNNYDFTFNLFKCENFESEGEIKWSSSGRSGKIRRMIKPSIEEIKRFQEKAAKAKQKRKPPRGAFIYTKKRRRTKAGKLAFINRFKNKLLPKASESPQRVLPLKIKLGKTESENVVLPKVPENTKQNVEIKVTEAKAEPKKVEDSKLEDQKVQAAVVENVTDDKALDKDHSKILPSEVSQSNTENSSKNETISIIEDKVVTDNVKEKLLDSKMDKNSVEDAKSVKSIQSKEVLDDSADPDDADELSSDYGEEVDLTPEQIFLVENNSLHNFIDENQEMPIAPEVVQQPIQDPSSPVQVMGEHNYSSGNQNDETQDQEIQLIPRAGSISHLATSGNMLKTALTTMIKQEQRIIAKKDMNESSNTQWICIAQGCRNNWMTASNKCLALPKEPRKRNLWLNALDIPPKERRMLLKHKEFVCEEHFTSQIVERLERKKSNKVWSDIAMDMAIKECINNGIGYRRASQIYGVPRSTLGKYVMKIKQGLSALQNDS